MQTFKTSVARILHVREHADCEILQKLQTLCNAHQEFTLISRRYETSSPVPDGSGSCLRYDDVLQPSASQCRPLSSSPSMHRRFVDSGFDHHFEDDDFSKKF